MGGGVALVLDAPTNKTGAGLAPGGLVVGAEQESKRLASMMDHANGGNDGSGSGTPANSIPSGDRGGGGNEGDGGKGGGAGTTTTMRDSSHSAGDLSTPLAARPTSPAARLTTVGAAGRALYDALGGMLVDPKHRCNNGVSGVGIDDPNGDDSPQVPAQAGSRGRCALIEKLRAMLKGGANATAAETAVDQEGEVAVLALEGAVVPSAASLEAIAKLLRHKTGASLGRARNTVRVAMLGAEAGESEVALDTCTGSSIPGLAEIKDLRDEVDLLVQNLQIVCY